MAKNIPIESLEEQINFLEAKRKTDLVALKTQLHITGQSMRPANLIKSAVQDVAESPQIRSVFAKAAIGLVIGLVARQVIMRKRGGPGLGKLALQFGLNMLIRNRYKLLKSVGTLFATALIARLRKRKEKRKAVQTTPSPSEPDASFSYSVH